MMRTDIDIPTLLSKYGATLNSDDVKILQKLQNYEKIDGFDLLKYSPLVWGVDGMKKYKSLQELGPGLWNRPQPDDVLELIDENLMYKSSRLLPLDINLDLKTGVSDQFRNQSLYDPRFFLPLFNVLLAPENVVSCKKFVQKNCLSFVFACLSCHDGQLRRSAYLILLKLSKYLSQSSAQFDEKPQLLYFLSIFRNSLKKSNNRLPSIIAIFLSRSSNLIFKPFDRMYSSIISFLLLKPTIDLKNVPEFYKFFHSSCTEFIHERRWILQLLLDGLREPKDYRIYEKRYVFKLFMSFYNSSISDEQSRDMIGKIIRKAARMKTSCKDLCFSHNLLGWISSTMGDRTNSEWSSIVLLAEIFLTVGETLKDDTKSFCGLKSYWLACFCTFLRVYRERNENETMDENFHRRLFNFVDFVVNDDSSFESIFVKSLIDSTVKN